MREEGSDTLTGARRRTVWLVLGPVLLLLALFLPAPPGMKPEAMKLVGVTALMAVWWLGEVVNLNKKAGPMDTARPEMFRL
jgi:sodium-dependent dicarboxylate transporter 2/3/5